MRDAWRLAWGTLTALPTRAPENVDRHVAGVAMALAPVTTVPAVAAWVALGSLGSHDLIRPAVVAALSLVVFALLSRAMHLDGLADLADGLTSGYDRDRSLEVMRRGDVGPAGVAAVVLVLLLDFACITALGSDALGLLLVSLAVVASRLAPVVLCRAGVPAARPGLGQLVAGTVPRHVRTVTVSAVALVAVGSMALVQAVTTPFVGDVVAGAAVGLAVVAVSASAAYLIGRRATARLGGITGDVIGAAIEVALAATLVSAVVLRHLL